jgi:acyl transferase domain-containing protein
MLEPFRRQVNSVRLNPPQIPWASTVTGDWVTAEDVTAARYWVRNIREPVRFADAIQLLVQDSASILLEAGPGRTLSTLARRCLSPDHPPFPPATLSSLRHPHDRQTDTAFILNSLGQLWLAGVDVDWMKFHAYGQHQRLPLPTYAFDHQHYWVEPQNLRQSRERRLFTNKEECEAKQPEQLQDQEHFTQKKESSSHTRRELPHPYVPPGNQLEQTLIEICQQILGISTVGIHDDFFDLGGDSLIIAQAISRINKALAIELSPRALFEKSTVATLADYIDTLRWASASGAQTAHDQGEEEGEI